MYSGSAQELITTSFDDISSPSGVAAAGLFSIRAATTKATTAQTVAMVDDNADASELSSTWIEVDSSGLSVHSDTLRKIGLLLITADPESNGADNMSSTSIDLLGRELRVYDAQASHSAPKKSAQSSPMDRKPASYAASFAAFNLLHAQALINEILKQKYLDNPKNRETTQMIVSLFDNLTRQALKDRLLESFPKINAISGKSADQDKLAAILLGFIPKKHHRTRNDIITFLSTIRAEAAQPDAAIARIIKLLVAHAKNLNNERCIWNTKRKEERFFGFALEQKGGTQHGLYLNVWQSNNAASTPKKLSEFVTAFCLIGAELQGIDNNEYSTAFIKHEIKFHPNQYIQDFNYNAKAANPYETALFEELAHHFQLMSTVSQNEKPKCLIHVPSFDYILFGIEQYLRGRIAQTALIKFINIILNKEEEIQGKVSTLAHSYNLEVQFITPFSDLFDRSVLNKLADTREDINGRAVLLHQMITDLYGEEIATRTIDENHTITCLRDPQQAEATLVAHCMKKMAAASSDSEADENCQLKLSEVWKDFKSDDAKNIETLFKIANSVVLGYAAKNAPAGEVASVMPVPEKQIQVEYSQTSKKLGYPSITNITALPQVAVKDRTSDNLFYSTQSPAAVRDIIKNYLTFAYEQAGTFACQGGQDLASACRALPTTSASATLTEPDNSSSLATTSTIEELAKIMSIDNVLLLAQSNPDFMAQLVQSLGLLNSQQKADLNMPSRSGPTKVYS